jgi:hypothetical protein
MSEFSKIKPNWIRDTGLVAVTIPPPPTLRKYSGGQRSDFEAQYDLNFSDAALDSLVRAGVTLVYVRFFSGFGIEFEKDNMERVHDYITRAHTRGIKVAAVVALGALTPETLLAEENDAQNWLQFNSDGRSFVPDQGGHLWNPERSAARVQTAVRPCYNSESFLRYIERVCGSAVDFGADMIYFDSVGYNAEPDACRCPICVGLFREFLRLQYGVQDDRTRQAGKDRFGHNSFTHARPPAYTAVSASLIEQADSPHEQEWIKFKAHTVAQSIARLSRAIFKRNPQCAVGAELLTQNIFADATHGLSSPQLLPHLDVTGLARRDDVFEDEPIAAEINPPRALQASAERGNDPRAAYEAQDADEMTAAETPEGALERVGTLHRAAIRNFKIARAFGGTVESPLEPAELETSLALQLAFNNKGIGIAGESLSPWFGPGWEHRAAGDKDLAVLRAYLDFYARHKQTLLLDTRTLSTVAVYRDTPSLSFDGGANGSAQLAFENLLIENNVPFDVIYTQHLDDLTRYRCVALAGCECLSDEIVRKLERYVSTGGGLLALSAAGRRDEWRRVRPQPAIAALCGPDFPQMLRRQNGSGRVAYLPALSEGEMGEAIELLEYISATPLPINADFEQGHALVEAVLTRSGAIAVHVVNTHENPVTGVRISLQCEQAPRQVIAHRITAPSESERESAVNVTWENGRAQFEFPEVARYVMFQIVS